MSESNITKIKSQLDIVDIVGSHIELTKRGKNYWGLCPFHDDSNPSMSVSPQKQLYKCFVCGAGGDLINFVVRHEQVSFSQALIILGQKIGLNIRQETSQKPRYDPYEQKLIDLLKDASEFFQYSLTTDEGSKAYEYIKSRGLSDELIEMFKIGYSPKVGIVDYLTKKGHIISDMINASIISASSENTFFSNQLMFAITNSHGDVVAFSARTLDDNSQPKYINSAESIIFSKSQILYNAFGASESIKSKKMLYLNEGFMDVIALTRAGVKNVVGLMGTALTKEHLRLIDKRVKVVLMLDGDEAGKAATLKSTALLLEQKIETYVVVNKANKDPDELLRDGKKHLLDVIENKIGALEFVYDFYFPTRKTISTQSINQFLKSFGLFWSHSSALEREFYLVKIAKAFELSVDVVKQQLPKIFVPKQSSSSAKENFAISKDEMQITKTIARNNSHALILSMIKRPNLIKLMVQNPINFNDPILVAIAKYLVDFKNEKSVSVPLEIRQKVRQISLENNFVESSKEFLELISRVNQSTKKANIDLYELKLNDTNDEDEKTRILGHIIKLKRQKG